MLEKIIELIDARKFQEIRAILEQENIVDVAELIEELPQEQTVMLFRLLPKETAADVFSYMSKDAQQVIVEGITDRELSGIVHALFIDDAVDFIEEMPANVVRRVLANTNAAKRDIINRFLQYHDDSAGSLMTIEFVALKKEMTVAQAFETIRRTGVNKETIYTCYVTDQNRLLDGIVTVKTLLLSASDAIIGDIMDTNVIFVSTDDDKEDIASMFQKYDLLSMPVVDRERRLVGIITIDDAIEVLQQENTEDFEKMAAMTPSEEPYLKTGIFEHAKHRIPWLLVLMISATFSGAILTRFQESFKVLPILVSFIPMLMDTGGNCGAQVSTLVIRGMALGEISGKDILHVWWKEVRVAAIVGAVLAMFNIARTWLLYAHDITLSITVSLSMYATVIIAKSVGCLLPIAAKQIKLDPAIMASPIITTVVDACALGIYFTIAKAILHI